MGLTERPTVLGLTGPFGSGSTTAAKTLRDARGFRALLLSDVIRAEWVKGKRKSREPSRTDLQRLGDDLRQEHGTDALARLGLHAFNESISDDVTELVVDGIRNVGEATYLQDLFGQRFTLIAVLSDHQARWDRVGAGYADAGLTQTDFLSDDERDRNEETPYGQQVELCIDQADVFIHNPATVTLGDFKHKVLATGDLLTGKVKRGPTPHEMYMNMAYAGRHGSQCLKRQVGAVLVTNRGEVVGVGFNENPLGTNPCKHEPEYDHQCYRDIVRNAHFEDLAERGSRCPTCSKPLLLIQGPPWHCPSCAKRGTRTNLESFFFPDRAMNWCTAVHAEVWAILAAGERARGSVLYTTTFPCFQCAEKLIHAGVSAIWFTEAYPDTPSFHRLDLAGVPYTQFEGVRSTKFERVFSS